MAHYNLSQSGMQPLEDGMVLRIAYHYAKKWPDLTETWCVHSDSEDPIMSSVSTRGNLAMIL